MRLDPIRSVMSDAGLRRRIADANAEAAYLTGYRRNPDEAARAGLVEAFLSGPPANCGEPLGAALDELAQLVDLDLARTVARRSAAIGYAGPLDGPCMATVSFGGRPSATVVAVPDAALTPKGAFVAVEVAGGRYWLDDDGEPAFTAMPWHWIVRTHPERPVPDIDVGSLGKRVAALVAGPVTDVSDEMLEAVLTALAEGAIGN